MNSVSNWLIIIYHGENMASYYSVFTKFFGGNDEIHVMAKEYITDNFSNKDNHITYEVHHTSTLELTAFTDDMMSKVLNGFNCLKFGKDLQCYPRHKVKE